MGVPVEALRLSATAHVIGDPSHAEGMLLPTGEGLGFAAWYDGSRFLIRTAGYGRSVVRRQGSAYPGQIQLSEVFFAGNAYVLAVRPLVFSHDNLGAKELHEALLSSRADAASYSGLRSDTPARLASRSELRTLATSVLPATWGHVKMIYR